MHVVTTRITETGGAGLLSGWQGWAARVVCAAAAVMIGPGLVAPAVAQQGYVWSTSTFDDERAAGGRSTFMTNGVPETDDRGLQANCPTASTAFASILLSYDTRGQRPGAAVDVNFYRNGRRIHTVSGAVSADTGSEEGLTGVRVGVAQSDVMWRMLSTGTNLQYQVGNRPRATMTLRGSQRAIAKFRDTCLKLLTALDANNEENNVASAVSCKLWGEVKSRDSKQPVTLRFTNRTRSERTAMWIDYNGQPVEYKRLAPGEAYTQKTFIGHPWMFVDGPGNCKELFVPTRTNQVSYNITFDN